MVKVQENSIFAGSSPAPSTFLNVKSNNLNFMETRNVKITLETAKRWYEQGGEFKEMALSAFMEAELNPVLLS